ELVFIVLFFQAEDGIRDRNVTGVQTCALPILPTFEGDTSNLAGNITNQNRGIYESITDVRTSDASNYLDQEFRIVRSEIYNYEEYYLLESIEDGSTIGWMYAGDVYTSALDEKPVEEPEKEKPSEEAKPEEETPAEENKP